MAYSPSGDEERAYLAAYRDRPYPRPCVTVDVVALACLDGALQVLLVRRAGFPFRGAWALPGGFVEVGDSFDDQGEDLDTAAARELAEETGLGIREVQLAQLFAVGTPGRDPRTRVISVVYLGLVPTALARRARAGDDAAAACWVSVSQRRALELAFDHGAILERALAHLGRELERSDLARPLLDQPSTQAELEALARAIGGPGFAEARFRRAFRRLVSDGVLQRVAGAGRARYRYA